MFRAFIIKSYQKVRVKLYSVLSTNISIGTLNKIQPVLFAGEGKIIFKGKVQIGYFPSPNYYETVSYIEAREKDAFISIDDNVIINNGLRIICDRTSIEIGANTLIGTNVEVIDSDFHGILPKDRRNGNYEAKPVSIGKNVFIGNNVIILKGVAIGDNSIIANGSVVVKSIPANSIAGGNPAKVIKSIYEA